MDLNDVIPSPQGRTRSRHAAHTRQGAENYQVVGPKLMTMRNGAHGQARDMTTESLPRRSNRERHRR